MLSKYCFQYISKPERPSSGHRTGKGQSSFQFPRRAVLKNVQTIEQLYLFAMLVKSDLKFCMLDFTIMPTKNFQMSKLGLEKAEEPEIKLLIFIVSWRKQRNSRKASTSVSSATLKSLTVWIITNCGKLLRRWAVSFPSVCLLYILCTSWEITSWIKTGGRNIKNLRHVEDTMLMSVSEEELKNLLWWWMKKVKERP